MPRFKEPNQEKAERRLRNVARKKPISGKFLGFEIAPSRATLILTTAHPWFKVTTGTFPQDRQSADRWCWNKEKSLGIDEGPLIGTYIRFWRVPDMVVLLRVECIVIALFRTTRSIQCPPFLLTLAYLPSSSSWPLLSFILEKITKFCSRFARHTSKPQFLYMTPDPFRSPPV